MGPSHTTDSLLRLTLLVLALGGLPLVGWWLWHRGQSANQRLAALTALIAFLTFDLIVFGAFTRLSDSGLGCPDWPGCYGQASPLGAQGHILSAQAQLPSGPVTWTKAWIEMIHRYLAMSVGLLITGALLAAWRHRRALPHSLAWPVLTLVWVILQGLFGKYTVTLKLYPAIVTLHLLGAMVLLGLLAVQTESFRASQPRAPRLGRRTLALALVAGVALVIQIALGGWVSTNYAVLACQGFPTCNGQWWPPMDVAGGFTLMRSLGRDGHGELAGLLPFDALVAIHLAHRAFALVASMLLLALALALRASVVWRSWGAILGGLVLMQVATGLFNVLLQWPLAAALLHTAGAAGLVLVLTRLVARHSLAGRA